jgi:hypothetical protein
MELKTQKINPEQYNDFKYIFIFGDSHSLCFGQGNTLVDNKYNIQMLNRDSASARGLINENSTLRYGLDITNFINFKKGFGIKPYNFDENNNYYLFKFGQVDVQINYYYKIIVKKENIIKKFFFEDIIKDYMDFLNPFKNSNIIVCGINLPNPTNYKRYLVNCFNRREDIKMIDDEIEKLTLEEMNNDTLFFNELLKNSCDNYSIKYFDLINECVVWIDKKIVLNPEYIGNDHHYKGCIGFNTIENNIKIYNEKNNFECFDYVNHLLYKKTYYTFIEKLILSLINSYFPIIVLNKNLSLLYLLNDINNYYFFHNNVINYKLIKYGNEIIINIDKILSKNNNLDENMKIFGMNIRVNSEIINLNVKIELKSNLPIKIFTGKKWLHCNTNIINDNILIENINKWRISISDDFLNKNLNKKNILHIIRIERFEIIL